MSSCKNILWLVVAWHGWTVGGLMASPEVPAAAQAKPIALVGATIHPVSGPVIEEGTILFADGKIVAVGKEKEVEIPKEAKRIDVRGKHVYPGLFDAHTDVGLVEINSVRATIDNSETGSINSNVRAWVAVNPDSEVIPVTRSNGVLLALSAPMGGLIAGRSAVLQLDGWTYEDLTIRSEIGMHVNWPNLRPSRRESSESPAGSADSPLRPLRKFWDQARAYQKARAAHPDKHPLDARLEAMLPVLDRRVPLIVSADDVRQIQSAVAFAVEHQVRLILHGGYDAAECASLLKQHDIPVVIAGTYRLPQRDSDPYDAAYTLPERLRQAGVRFCIASSGKFGASGVRNLPYHAATACAFGLPAEEGLKAITLYPAQILGVSDRVGTLEPGKDATLFLSTGDPLDTSTQVETVYVRGGLVELNDRHKRLWKKYEEKYRRQAE